MGILGRLHHLFWFLLVGNSLPTVIDAAKLPGSVISITEKETGNHAIKHIPIDQLEILLFSESFTKILMLIL